MLLVVVASVTAIPAPQFQQPRQVAPAPQEPKNLNPDAEQLEGSNDEKDLKGSASYGYGYYGGHGHYGYGGYGYPYSYSYGYPYYGFGYYGHCMYYQPNYFSDTLPDINFLQLIPTTVDLEDYMVDTITK